MGKTKEYSEAVSEVLELLQMSDEGIISKIPLEVIQQMNKNKSKTYKSKFDETKPITENDLSEKAKAILAFLYRDYICSEEEKEEINKILFENEQEKAKENLESKENKLQETELQEEKVKSAEKTEEKQDKEETERQETTETEENINPEEFVNVLPEVQKKGLFRRIIENFFFYDDGT